MAEEFLRRVSDLTDAMDLLEQEIAKESEVIKQHYVEAFAKMPDGKNYFLSGIVLGSVVKPYLLTSKGVEVQGEGIIPVQDFIDGALKFANYPKRKIEVLRELAVHLQHLSENHDDIGGTKWQKSSTSA